MNICCYLSISFIFFHFLVTSMISVFGKKMVSWKLIHKTKMSDNSNKNFIGSQKTSMFSKLRSG